jgi:molybdenum cofactor cytidylyltransferase
MSKNTEIGNFAAILLAAGPSSRLGQSKQLVKVAGESLVRKAVRLIQTQEPISIVVVTGSHSESVEQEIADLPVNIVFNRDWARGMGGSISCGVHNIPEDVDGILIMVCDQWRLEADDLSSLISDWRSDISRVIVTCWSEGKAFVSGPPVIFPRKLKQELKFVQEDRGARQVIDRHMDIVEFVTMENAAWDLDRPEDIEKLMNSALE